MLGLRAQRGVNYNDGDNNHYIDDIDDYNDGDNNYDIDDIDDYNYGDDNYDN